MAIVTRPATKEYRDNFDAVFGKKEEPRPDTEDDEDTVVTEEEPKEQTE